MLDPPKMQMNQNKRWKLTGKTSPFVVSVRRLAYLFKQVRLGVDAAESRFQSKLISFKKFQKWWRVVYVYRWGPIWNTQKRITILDQTQKINIRKRRFYNKTRKEKVFLWINIQQYVLRTTEDFFFITENAWGMACMIVFWTRSVELLYMMVLTARWQFKCKVLLIFGTARMVKYRDSLYNSRPKWKSIVFSSSYWLRIRYGGQWITYIATLRNGNEKSN